MHGLLTAERTMLNLVCHLSGIATATAAWVDAVDGTKAKIRDTRKTLPGLRALQKYAVRVGGGVNHRMGLGDAALIKDNHVAAAGSVVAALRAVRAAAPDLPCEVEVDSLEQLDEILAEGVELVLLDNFPVWQTQIAVQRRDTRAPAPNSSPRAGFRSTPRPTMPGPAWTTSPSGRSPIRCGCSTSASTSRPVFRRSPARRRGAPAEAPGRLTQSRFARFIGRSPKVVLQQRFRVGSFGDGRTRRAEFAVTAMRGERRVDGWPTGHIHRLGGDHHPRPR